MPVYVNGSEIPLIRGWYTCLDCGILFDPVKGTATKRCKECREIFNKERPDRKNIKEAKICIDCNLSFQPSQKGAYSDLCPACRLLKRRIYAKEFNQQLRNQRGSTPRVKLESRETTCKYCDVALIAKSKGKLPTTCKDCRKSLNRKYAAEKNNTDAVSLKRAWLKVINCLDCGVPIPPVEAGKRRNTRCHECRAKHRKPYQKNPAKNREKHLRRFYGISVETYNKMYSDQEGKCNICKMPHEVLHVDHDHESRSLRALLCGSCNRMLGLAKDDPNILENAIQYLKKWQ